MTNVWNGEILLLIFNLTGVIILCMNRSIGVCIHSNTRKTINCVIESEPGEQ